MEDPNMEREIQEYSPSKEGEVTTVRWIFNKGLWLGKKVVITGVAISSAPLVLPPLVVFSALGFAFSVPFGLVFASYACTDKLMNKLLPPPETSPMLEYYTDEDEEEGKEGFGKLVMEEEEEELEDTKRGVGMRIYVDEDDDYWQKDVDSWEEQPTIYSAENVEAEGYEDDVGEYVEGKDDYTQKIERRDENQGEEYNGSIDEIGEEEGYEDVGKYVEGEDDYTGDKNQGEEYKEYINENMEEEGYEEDVGEYVEGKEYYTQEIEMRDENRGEEYKKYNDENVEEGGYEDDVGEYVEGVEDYTQEMEMRDKNKGEDYKKKIGENVEVEDDNVENVEVEDDNVEEIEVREEGDREELVSKGSKDEEQLGEISRVAVVVAGDKERHENDGEVKGLNLAVTEVKGDVEIKVEPVGNEVKIGLDEIESPAFDMGKNVEREGYKEDAVEYMEGEDESMEGTEIEIEVREEGDRQILVGEKGNDEMPLDEIREVVILVPGNEDNEKVLDSVVSEVRGSKEIDKQTTDDEDTVRESTGLLEKIRDDGNVGNDVTKESDDAKGMRGVDENEEGKNAIRDPIGYPLEDDNVLLKKLVEEVKETGEKERAVEVTPISFEGDVKLDKPSEKIDNVALENQERNFFDMVEQVGEAQDKGLGNGNTIGYVNGKLAAKSFGGYLDRTEEQKPKVEEQVGEAQDKGLGYGNTIGYVNGNLAAKSFGGYLDRTKEQKPEVEEKLAVWAADRNSVDHVEDMNLKKRENVISSNADMREIADESGFDLFDDRNKPSDQKSYPALLAKDDFSEGTTEVNVDYMALPTSTRVFDSSHVKNELEKDEVPSGQVQLKEDEKKLWEQIDAMRAIVGYKVERQQTCIEELEALYIFTGVEPPASFKDPTDLSDVNHKLRFLMSIVGVR